MEEDNQRDRKIGRRGKDKKERARYVRISWSSIFCEGKGQVFRFASHIGLSRNRTSQTDCS